LSDKNSLLMGVVLALLICLTSLLGQNVETLQTSYLRLSYQDKPAYPYG
jgi:hypothetical protein